MTGQARLEFTTMNNGDLENIADEVLSLLAGVPNLPQLKPDDPRYYDVRRVLQAVAHLPNVDEIMARLLPTPPRPFETVSEFPPLTVSITGTVSAPSAADPKRARLLVFLLLISINLILMKEQPEAAATLDLLLGAALISGHVASAAGRAVERRSQDQD